jgi:hypothetical protein
MNRDELEHMLDQYMQGLIRFLILKGIISTPVELDEDPKPFIVDETPPCSND